MSQVCLSSVDRPCHSCLLQPSFCSSFALVHLTFDITWRPTKLYCLQLHSIIVICWSASEFVTSLSSGQTFKNVCRAWPRVCEPCLCRQISAQLFFFFSFGCRPLSTGDTFVSLLEQPFVAVVQHHSLSLSLLCPLYVWFVRFCFWQTFEHQSLLLFSSQLTNVTIVFVRLRQYTTFSCYLSWTLLEIAFVMSKRWWRQCLTLYYI